MNRNIHKAVSGFGLPYCVFDAYFTKYNLDDNIKYFKKKSIVLEYFHSEFMKHDKCNEKKYS